MKHETTPDDEAVKRASNLQRHREKDDSPEMEDRQNYAKRKKALDDGYGKEQKKEARKSREQTNKLIKNIVPEEENK